MLTTLIESLEGHLEGGDDLLEFREDLMKQMIILVGSPASGKSYFVQHSFGKWAKGATLGKSFPGVLGLHTTATLESDNSLRRMQYKAAQEDYGALKKAKDEDSFNKIIQDKKFSYQTDHGVEKLSGIVTWEAFQEFRSFGAYYGRKGHPVNKYYVSMRGRGKGKDEGLKEMARKFFFDQTSVAIKRHANVILIDSAGEDINKTPFEKFLKLAEKEGYSPSLVQLHIPLSLSIARNNLRGKKGRAVPEAQIKSAFNAMDAVVGRLRKDPRLDRFVKYKWKATGSGPFDGAFAVGTDDKMALTRRIKELKAQGKMGKRLAADHEDGMEAKLLALLEEAA